MSESLTVDSFEVMYDHQKYRDDHRNNVVRVTKAVVEVGKRALDYANISGYDKGTISNEQSMGLVAMASRYSEEAHIRMAYNIVHAAHHYDKHKETIQEEALKDAYNWGVEIKGW